MDLERALDGGVLIYGVISVIMIFLIVFIILALIVKKVQEVRENKAAAKQANPVTEGEGKIEVEAAGNDQSNNVINSNEDIDADQGAGGNGSSESIEKREKE